MGVPAWFARGLGDARDPWRTRSPCLENAHPSPGECPPIAWRTGSHRLENAHPSPGERALLARRTHAPRLENARPSPGERTHLAWRTHAPRLEKRLENVDGTSVYVAAYGNT